MPWRQPSCVIVVQSRLQPTTERTLAVRAALVACCTALASFALCLVPARAHAGDMDLALSRARRGASFCVADGISVPVGATYCKDQELFERLVSELAVAMAPPTSGPARSIGARGFSLQVDTTLTGIDAGQTYWVRGTEGSQALAADDELGENASPSPVLTWNRIQVKKGMPFGFEAGAAFGQGMQTSLWTLGLMLKWSLFEGFRSGFGRLPDVAVQTGVSRSVGSSQASVRLITLDLTLSKPFVVEHTWTVSPLGGIQTLFVHVDSGVVDLTPGGTPVVPGEAAPENAFDTCAPNPNASTGTQKPPDVTPNGQPCAQPGGGADFGNSVVFDPVSQTRVRAFAGAQLRYDMWLLLVALHYDLATPGVAASTRLWGGSELPRLLAFNVALGAVL